MARFQVTVRVLDLVEPDVTAARRKVEEQLQVAGFDSWQIVGMGLQGAAAPAKAPYRAPRRRPNPAYTGAGMLLAAAFAWALWFAWLIGS